MALSGHPVGAIVQVILDAAKGRKDLASAPFGLFSAMLMICSINAITIVLTALSPLVTLWINFVSSVGFQALGSQCVLSLSSTYLMAVGCSFYSRFARPHCLGMERKGLFQLGASCYVTHRKLSSSAILILSVGERLWMASPYASFYISGSSAGKYFT